MLIMCQFLTKYTLVILILPITWKTKTNTSILAVKKLKSQMGWGSCAGANNRSRQATFGSVSHLLLVLSRHWCDSWEDGVCASETGTRAPLGYQGLLLFFWPRKKHYFLKCQNRILNYYFNCLDTSISSRQKL